MLTMQISELLELRKTIIEKCQFTEDQTVMTGLSAKVLVGEIEDCEELHLAVTHNQVMNLRFPVMEFSHTFLSETLVKGYISVFKHHTLPVLIEVDTTNKLNFAVSINGIKAVY